MSKSMRSRRHRLYARIYTRLYTHTTGRASDRGVSALEYVGMVIIVAAIILAIRQTNIATMIATGVSNAVQKVVGGG